MERATEVQYFESLSSIYRGIIKEKKNFTSLLGPQWDSLPEEEQNVLLDEHFVAPHIRQKYNQKLLRQEENNDGVLEYPEESSNEYDYYLHALKIKSGQRIVEDDEVCLVSFHLLS